MIVEPGGFDHGTLDHRARPNRPMKDLSEPRHRGFITPVHVSPRRPSRPKEELMTRIRRTIGGVAVMAMLIAPALPARAQDFTFVKLADSAEDGFDPFSFGCATINAADAVAFRAGRLAPDGFNTILGSTESTRTAR
jgi:hypothetical protein